MVTARTSASILASALLCIATLVGMTACGGDKAPKSTTTTSTNTTTTQDTGDTKSTATKTTTTEQNDGTQTVHRVETSDHTTPAPTK